MHAGKDELRHSALNWLALALGIGGGTVLVVLLARTAVGAIDRQPGPWTIAGLAAAGFTVALTVWRLDDALRLNDPWRRRSARAAAALLSGLLFGLLVARDSTAGVVSVVVMALTWTAAAAVRLWPAIEARLSCPGPPQLEAATTTTASPTVSANVVTLDAPVAMSSPASMPLEIDDDRAVQMQLRRRRTGDGETVELQARLEFVAGAREAVLHVPFWPALSGLPVVECEPLNGDDIELRVTAAERYGLRLEGRLPTITGVARSVLIGIEVQVTSEASDVSAAA